MSLLSPFSLYLLSAVSRTDVQEARETGDIIFYSLLSHTLSLYIAASRGPRPFKFYISIPAERERERQRRRATIKEENVLLAWTRTRTTMGWPGTLPATPGYSTTLSRCVPCIQNSCLPICARSPCTLHDARQKEVHLALPFFPLLPGSSFVFFPLSSSCGIDRYHTMCII